ncbi:MAG: hypothetical protein U0930_10675 [Pirellulales bacterium]
MTCEELKALNDYIDGAGLTGDLRFRSISLAATHAKSLWTTAYSRRFRCIEQSSPTRCIISEDRLGKL